MFGCNISRNTVNVNKVICFTLNKLKKCDRKLFSTSSLKATTETIIPTIEKHLGASAGLPLIEHYRPRWPEPAFNIDETNKLSVSPSSKVLPRTVPDSKLRFKLKSTFDHGASIFYPHLKFHAADYKVTLFVSSYSYLYHNHSFIHSLLL